jgi:hypothetical protein
VQEKLLEAVKVGQEASLNAVKEWVDAFSSIMPKLPEWTEAFTSIIPKTQEWSGSTSSQRVPDLFQLPSVDNLIGFTEQLWQRQREFNMNLYETIAPLGQSVFGAAKSSAAKAANAAASAEHSAARTTSSKA